jgi:DNA (cytosine-5)-methyltransferase 1
MDDLNCISLFSGAMGLDLGFEMAGFKILAAADNMPSAVATIRANRPELPVLADDVRKLTGDQLRQVAGVVELDVLVGGPPCQSFSTAGKRLSVEDELSGNLVFEFIRLLGELRPKAFVFENVKGILSASLKWRELPYNNNGKRIDELHGSAFRHITTAIKDLGYSVDFAELNAADYGVPQRRIRVFTMGFRDGHTPLWPEPTHARQPDFFRRPWEAIGSYISDLENENGYCAKFSERKLKYLRRIPPGGNWRDLNADDQRESMGKAFHAKGGRSGYWRRLSMDEPAPTILTEPQNASTALCHPNADRPLSVRECARLQTFPDSWVFCGRGGDQYRLIGNAVPVRLAEQIGLHVRFALEGRPTGCSSQDLEKPSLRVNSAEQLSVI